MLPYLGIEAIEKDEIKQFADWYSTVHSTEQDIFVVRTGGRNGLVLKGRKGVVGSTLFCLSPLWIDRDFLYYFLKLNEFQSSGERDLINIFWNTPVPVVSLEKQKQIAKGIKEALSSFEQQNKELEHKLIQSLKSLVSIDSDTLENIQSLDDFKKAVLDLAVSGKLTETKKNWTTYKIGDLFTIQTGFTPSRSNLKNWHNGTIHWIKSGEVNNNFITSSDEKISDSVFKGTNIKLIPMNTILMALSGQGKTRGRVGLSKIEAFINQNIAAFINEEMYWETKVFVYYSLLNQYHHLREVSGDNTRNTLNLNTIKNTIVSIPPINEQGTIVKLIEDVLNLAEKINNNYQKEQNEHQKLQNSIILSFYKDLYFDGDIKDILSIIEAERAKKNIEIFDLRNKQKLFRDSQSTLSKMEIIEILKSSNIPIQVNSLWEKSKYKGNIDAFYEALKHEFDNNSIKWELQQKDSDVPQSYIALT